MPKLISQRLLDQNNRSETAAGCCCCGGTIIIIAAVILIVGNNATTLNCSIDLFDTHGINNRTTTTQTIINYDLVDVDGEAYMVEYDDINLEFYYKPNHSSIGIANITYPAFHQKYGQSHLAGFIDGSGLDWENVRAAVTQNRSAVFRVDLHTSFRCSSMYMFKTKRHHLAVGADLHVNDQGKLIKGKKNHNVKLTSGAPNISQQGYLHILPFLALLAFLHLGFIFA